MIKPKIELIYSDDKIIVINKPAGVSVTKDRTGAAQLTDMLSGRLQPEELSSLRLVHRLDKDTSGVMILARNKPTQSEFSGYFEKQLVRKTYLAIVAGAPLAHEGTINTPLKRHPKKPALMCATSRKGKNAITKWKLLAGFGSVALLAVSPLTGRTHQIRVHLASIKLPVAIDPLYGSRAPLLLSDFKQDYRLTKDRNEKPLIERLTLHAYQIQLPSPQPNRPCSFIAALDKKFAATIKMLTKHNPNGLNAFLDPTDFDKILKSRSLY